MGIFFLCPNKGHLNVVEDQVFKVMKLLLSSILQWNFYVKLTITNNKAPQYSMSLGYKSLS